MGLFNRDLFVTADRQAPTNLSWLSHTTACLRAFAFSIIDLKKSEGVNPFHNFDRSNKRFVGIRTKINRYRCAMVNFSVNSRSNETNVPSSLTPLPAVSAAGLLMIIALFPGLAFATTVPLATDNQWLSLGGAYCGAFPTSSSGFPTCVGTASGSLATDTQYSHQSWADNLGISQVGGGSISANALRIYTKSNASASRASAVMQDTYTLSGAEGDVDIKVLYEADGYFNILDDYLGRPAGRGTANIKIGTSMLRDELFGGTDVGGPTVGEGYTTGFIFENKKIDFQLKIEKIITVTAGTAFDLAFFFALTNSNAVEGNGLNTALIDFELPDSYTLTSEGGWTSPSALTPVPLPAALPLFATGLVGLGFAGYRRRKEKTA